MKDYLTGRERILLAASDDAVVANKYADFVRAEARAIVSGESFEVSDEELDSLKKAVVYSAVPIMGGVSLETLHLITSYSSDTLTELVRELVEEGKLVLERNRVSRQRGGSHE